MDSVAIGLTRLSRLNNLALEERAALFGSTSAECSVLGALVLGEPVLRPSALTSAIVQSPGGLTKTLRRLEESGLIKRRADPADRRTLLVVLTATGRRAAERWLAESNRYYEDLLRDFSADERAMLSFLIRRVLDRLEPAMGVTKSAGRVESPTNGIT